MFFDQASETVVQLAANTIERYITYAEKMQTDAVRIILNKAFGL